MFDLGWGEMLVVGVLALIVLGPQDLLTSFRSVGRWVGKMQKMAREFTRAMNDAADQAGVGEINKSLKAVSNPTKFGADSLKSAAGMGPETKALAEKRNAETKEKLEAALERQKAKMAAEEEAAQAANGAGEDPGMVDDTYTPPAAAAPTAEELAERDADTSAEDEAPKA